MIIAKRKRLFNDEIIEKRIKEGRGKGEGDKYKPWITVRDISSIGRCTEVTGWKTNGRIHQLLSGLESKYFYTLEWSSVVIDIREQYPLLDEFNSYEETLKIADNIGVKYSKIPFSNSYNVMTTDFLITINLGNGKTELKARTVKYANELKKIRVIEKLEIERLYWEKRNVDWKIVTEKDINKILAYNVELIHNYKSLKGLNIDQQTVKMVEALLKENSNLNISFTELANKIDVILNLEIGTSMAIIKYLIANKHIKINMKKRWDTSKPIQFIDRDELPLNE